MGAYRTLAIRAIAVAFVIGVMVPAVAKAGPSAPSGPSPASAATAVPISTSLTWIGSADATTYDVAFGTTSSPPLVSTGQAATSYTPPAALAYSKKYYWRITARGPAGSTAGPLWSFTTVAAPPVVPGTPSPVDGATAVATSTALKWAASTRATSYDVAFGTSNPPAVVSSGQTARSYTPPAPLAYTTTYYWQITANGASGSTAGPVWSFTTNVAPPAKPSGPSPATGATAVSTSTSVSWAASPGASTYDVAFGTTSSPPLVSAGQAATSYTPPAPLSYSTKYCWRITGERRRRFDGWLGVVLHDGCGAARHPQRSVAGECGDRGRDIHAGDMGGIDGCDFVPSGVRHEQSAGSRFDESNRQIVSAVCGARLCDDVLLADYGEGDHRLHRWPGLVVHDDPGATREPKRSLAGERSDRCGDIDLTDVGRLGACNDVRCRVRHEQSADARVDRSSRAFLYAVRGARSCDEVLLADHGARPGRNHDWP